MDRQEINVLEIEQMAYITAVTKHGIKPNYEFGRSSSALESTVVCYEREVPLFVASEMERLYENLYSSIPHFLSEGKLQDTNTYVVRKGSELTTLFLFKIKKNRVEVLNEVIKIEADDINRFARYVFDTYKKVQVISFRSIQTDFQELPFQFQRFNCLEDFVLKLPSDEESYMRSLGASTRSVLRRKLKMISRDFPSFTFRVFEREEIDEKMVREIIQFNRARMSGKSKTSSVAEAETVRIVNLAKECGMVVVACIDGRVCAGVISCRVGVNYFSLMVAHDPTYNAYSLGLLCNYRAICETIARGAKEFHFLWGRYRFKYTFLAALTDLDYLAIYRSNFQFVLNGRFAFKVWRNGIERKLSLWLHQLKQEKSTLSTVVVKILNYRKKLMGAKLSSLE
jgi:hypothetical protein